MKSATLVSILVACSSPTAPAPVTTAPTPAVAVATPCRNCAITIRNDSGQSVHLTDTTSGDLVTAVDVEGKLAPVGLYTPPFPCEMTCGDATVTPCNGPRPDVMLVAGATHEIAWDGSLRALAKDKTGWPCNRRIEAPPGDYVLQACSSEAGCVTQRVTLPAHAPIVLALQPARAAPVACDPATVTRALRGIYARARLEGVTGVDSCPLQATCDGPELDTSPGTCRAAFRRFHETLIGEIRPAAIAGAPRKVEVWIDGNGIATGNFSTMLGTWGVTSDGTLFVAGEGAHAMHTHGGAAAKISGAPWKAFNRGAAPRTIRLRTATWLTSVGNRVPLVHAAFHDNGTTLAELVVPPHGERAIDLGFETQEAYQASNERFFVDLELDIDGASLHTTSEIAVSRVDPIRPH